MPGVVLLLALPLIAAVLVYLLRRWPLPSIALAGLVAALLGWLMWRWLNEGAVLFLGRVVRPGQPMIMLGQSWEMTPTAQWVIGFLALTLAVTYVGAWRVSPGRSFFPFGLLLLALLSAVLLIQPLWRAPIVLAAALSMAAFIVQAGRRGSTRGALRLLWLPVLVIPLFLLAAWYVDQTPLDPENLAPLQTAGVLTSIGLWLLLAPWPFHGPALSLGEEAPPMVGAWLLTALAVIPVALLHGFLTQYEWLQSASLIFGFPNLRLPELLIYGGLAGSLWAGMAALVQRDLQKQWSYAAMFSHSAVLISLGLGARSSWGLVWLLLAGRSLGLLVSGFGLSVIRQRAAGNTDYQSVSGLGTRLPWASAALLLGSLSMAGLPLTVGFAGQWTLVQALGRQDWLRAVIVLGGALALAIGLLRSQRVLLGHLRNLLLEREEALMVALAALGLLAIIVPALWPEIWRDTLSAAVGAFSVGGPGS